eukprot:Lankesteria_metandrocarpae@DN3028_c0_g1_i1.p1
MLVPLVVPAVHIGDRTKRVTTILIALIETLTLGRTTTTMDHHRCQPRMMEKEQLLSLKKKKWLLRLSYWSRQVLPIAMIVIITTYLIITANAATTPTTGTITITNTVPPTGRPPTIRQRPTRTTAAAVTTSTTRTTVSSIPAVTLMVLHPIPTPTPTITITTMTTTVAVAARIGLIPEDILPPQLRSNSSASATLVHSDGTNNAVTTGTEVAALKMVPPRHTAQRTLQPTTAVTSYIKANLNTYLRSDNRGYTMCNDATQCDDGLSGSSLASVKRKLQSPETTSATTTSATTTASTATDATTPKTANSTAATTATTTRMRIPSESVMTLLMERQDKGSNEVLLCVLVPLGIVTATGLAYLLICDCMRKKKPPATTTVEVLEDLEDNGGYSPTYRSSHGEPPS